MFDPKTGQSALERCGRRLCTDRGQLSKYESPFQEMLAIGTEKKIVNFLCLFACETGQLLRKRPHLKEDCFKIISGLKTLSNNKFVLLKLYNSVKKTLKLSKF